MEGPGGWEEGPEQHCPCRASSHTPAIPANQTVLMHLKWDSAVGQQWGQALSSVCTLIPGL